MNNPTIYVIVEGQTEQTFVRDILAPELALKKIFLFAVLIGKPGHKGGDIRFERAKDDIGNLLRQRADTYVTTMFDYFRINSEWPGKNIIIQHQKEGSSLSADEKATTLEENTCIEINNYFSKFNAAIRFFSYIEMHEFEAMLFSDPHFISIHTGIDLNELISIRNKHKTPEDINDNPIYAPSKQLVRLKLDYRKVAMGNIIAHAIGINIIRKQCPHFNRWINKMENLFI